MDYLVTIEQGTAAGRSGLLGVEPEFRRRYDTGTAGNEDAYIGPDETGDGPVWVLDGLTIGWDSDGYPEQPEPMTCTYRLLAADPDALPPLEVGTLVYVSVSGYVADYDTPGDNLGFLDNIPVATFYGRISDPTVRPVMFNGLPHLEVSVLAVSHEVDFAESYIGAQPWPEEAGYARMARIHEAAGLNQGFTWTGGTGAAAIFRALDVDHRDFMDLMDDHLRQVTTLQLLGGTGVDTGWQRGIVQPQIGQGEPTDDGQPGEVLAAVEGLPERRTGGPRVFVQVDRLLTTLAQDTITSGTTTTGVTGAATVSAAVCAFALEWRRDKAALPNRVDVAGEFLSLGVVPAGTTVRAEHEDQVAAHGPITRRADSTLKYAEDATAMAGMYLPDHGEYVGRWGAESVTVYLDALTDRHRAAALLQDPPLFPWHGTSHLLQEAAGYPFGHTFHVHGLQAAHRLGGAGYVAGTIRGAVLTLSGSAPANHRAVLTVRLLPAVRRPAGLVDPPATYDAATYASPATLKAHHPTVTVRDVGDGLTPYVDPALTPYDARLIRHEEASL